MSLSREDVLNQLAEAKWDKEMMAFAIADRRQKRAEKGLEFNCFVLDRNNKETDSDELIQFVDHLHENLNSLPDKTRFQLAIRTGVHWTACDVMVDNGQLKLFVIDAAEDESHIHIISLFEEKFKNNIEVYDYIPGTMPDTEQPRLIQADNFSCSRFTLDHLFHISLVNVFSDFSIAKNNDKMKPLNFVPHFYKVSPDNCPDSLASVLRNTQSWTVLNSLPDNIKNRIINQKGETLIESATMHSQEVELNKDGNVILKKLNRSIEYKKDKISTNVIQYYDHHTTEELDKLLEDRTGFQFITSAEYRKEERDKLKEILSPDKAIIQLIGKKIQDLQNELSFSSQGILGRWKINKDIVRLKAIKARIESMNDNKLLAQVVWKKSKKLSKSVKADLRNALTSLLSFTPPQKLKQRIKAAISKKLSYFLLAKKSSAMAAKEIKDAPRNDL